MSLRDDDATLLDIADAARAIVRIGSGVSAETLARDDVLLSALLYTIVILGEAAKRLSAEFRAKCPAIDWL